MIPEIFSKVLNMSLTASLVIGIVIAARFALRKSPKIFSYALWAVVLFRLLCPVSIPSPLSAFGFLDASTAPNEGITTSIEYVEVYREVIEQPQAPAELPELPEMAEQVHTPNTETPKEPLSLKAVLPWLWLAGVVGMMLFGIVTYVRFRVHLTGAVPMERNVYLVDHIDSAFVAGVLRPRIYLPSDLPETEMSYILEHEKYHLRRLDHVAKHLAFLALSIHWFNPLVWVAFILSGKDMEMSCDEAVIQKLGEGIRADYSVSLLNLATGRKIIAGSPLAFGEGDTKGRVLNMARWKQPKKWVRILSFVLCIAILTACAANPDKEVVISKNDGSFDANVVQSATNPTGTAQAVQYTDSFFSTDGTVDFTMNIDTEVSGAAMPVVEVQPYFLTSEDAQRIARALLGDAEFFEAEPRLAPAEERLTRQEVLEAIQRWTPYTSTENFADIYPNWKDSPDLLEQGTQGIKDTIEQYTLLLDTIPANRTHDPAEWRYQLSSNYFYTPEQFAELEVDTSEDGEQIRVTATCDGIPYWLQFDVHNDSAYKLSSIYLTFSKELSPHDIDYYIFSRNFLATSKPTADQMRQAQQKAQSMLDQMGIGDWKVDDCYLSVNEEASIPEYTIVVTAVPVFDGVPAVRRYQLGNLKSATAYASNFYLTDATFSFNANGQLVACDIVSPVAVTEVVNRNAATMHVDELISRAKNHLTLSDRENYGVSGEYLKMMEGMVGEAYQCKVDICQMEYGLIRVKAPNTDDRYYYVPGVIFSGTVDYVGMDTGIVYETSGTHFGLDRIVPLVAINAVDGTIIELENPET